MDDTRLQLLISRVTDGDASEQEWQEFVGQADARPKLWRELAQTQRDQTALMRVVSDAGAVAEGAPVRIVDEPPSMLPRLGAWSGWAAAAAIAVIAISQLNAPVSEIPQGATPMMEAGLPNFNEALQQYLDTGRESGNVIGELPNKVLVESRPIQTGTGFEVIYIRQVMERTVVPEMYEVAGQDELGRPTLVRFNAPPQGNL